MGQTKGDNGPHEEGNGPDEGGQRAMPDEGGNGPDDGPDEGGNGSARGRRWTIPMPEIHAPCKYSFRVAGSRRSSGGTTSTTWAAASCGASSTLEQGAVAAHLTCCVLGLLGFVDFCGIGLVAQTCSLGIRFGHHGLRLGSRGKGSYAGCSQSLQHENTAVGGGLDCVVHRDLRIDNQKMLAKVILVGIPGPP